MSRPTKSKPTIFVGSSLEGKPLAEVVAKHLEAQSVVTRWWTKGNFPHEFPPLAVLEDELRLSNFGVFVASPDDKVTIRRGPEREAMRDNVLFEFGLFAGRLGRERTHLLLPDSPRFRIPSDLLGVKCLSYQAPEGGLRGTGEDAWPLVLGQALTTLSSAIETSWEVQPPEMQTARERGRRLLRFIAWARSEIGGLEISSGRDFQAHAGTILGASRFLLPDLAALGLQDRYEVFVRCLWDAAETCPTGDLDDLVPSRYTLLVDRETRGLLGSERAVQLRPYGFYPEDILRRRMVDLNDPDRRQGALLQWYQERPQPAREEAVAGTTPPGAGEEPGPWGLLGFLVNTKSQAAMNLRFHWWWRGVSELEREYLLRYHYLRSWYKDHQRPIADSFSDLETGLHDALFGSP